MVNDRGVISQRPNAISQSRTMTYHRASTVILFSGLTGGFPFAFFTGGVVVRRVGVRRRMNH